MEDNKLIAEFMGDDYEGIVFSAKDDLYNIGHRNDEYINAKYKLYHNSWDWLMPPVHKCLRHLDSSLDNYEFDISFQNAFMSFSIEEMYKEVVYFINWYNIQNHE